MSTDTTIKLSNAEQCRKLFPPKLKRAQVMELGARFGFSQWTIRCLIEGEGAAVKVERFAKQKRGYFDREKVIGQLFPE